MKILFVISFLIPGFAAGSFLGGLTLSGNEGLAGSAIVFWYGLFGGIAALLISVFLIRKLKITAIKKITVTLAIVTIALISWLVVKVQTKSSNDEQKKKQILKPTEPVTAPASLLFNLNIDEQKPMGLGMARPDFFNKRVLYFYSQPNLEKSVSEHLPSDSIVFMQTEHHQFEISYAPPWFYPEHMKMDYEILYLKILTLGRDWIEVELNKDTGVSTWVSASDVKVILWQEFLLTVFSVENPDEENNYLRIKPLHNASRYHINEYSFLQPVMIKENWLKVNLIDDNLNKVGEAWLQWQSDGQLLISYNLLS